MSRQTKRDSARTARLEAVRMQQRRSAHRRTAVIVAASLAVVGLVGGTAWAVVGAGGSGSSTGGKVALTGLQTYSGLARDHVATPVVYPQKPPVGGAHSQADSAGSIPVTRSIREKRCSISESDCISQAGQRSFASGNGTRAITRAHWPSWRVPLETVSSQADSAGSTSHAACADSAWSNETARRVLQELER
jgi:hypothetical protein